MKQSISIAFAIGFISLCHGQSSGIISTVAGNGQQAYSGDSITATSSALYTPVAVAVDASGNLFIGDQFNYRVRKVDANGIITTVAGTGKYLFTGDAGPATSAAIGAPVGLAFDTAGNLYISDAGNQRIRKVTPAGIISTVAGNGGSGYTGDTGPATQTTLYNPVGVVVDRAGNILIADQSNHRIRKVDVTGIITTIAGNGTQGFSGDGALATLASLNNPTALALDVAGNLYISDQSNHRIRKVDTLGNITTVAGIGIPGYAGDGAAATSATLNSPGGIVVDPSGNIVFSDDQNFRVRGISPTGIISTIAGNGIAGFSGDGGAATSASFNGQFGVAFDTTGNLYVADSLNNRVRKVLNASLNNPSITSAGVLNAASNVVGLSPGSLATIYGVRLSTVKGIITAPSTPWPAQLSGTSVTIGGIPAPINVVANVNGLEQINLQVPLEITGQTATSVIVTSGGVTSQPVSVPVYAAQPGVFTFDGTNAAVLHGATNLPVGSTNPAARGEIVVIFATGLGLVTPSVGTGNPASGVILSPTTYTPTVTVAGASAGIAFSGLAPGFIGLYQINAIVPTTAPSGSDDLIVTVNGNVGKTVKLAIQ